MRTDSSTKRYHQTQALMGATRPASGIKAKIHTPNKGSQTVLITRLYVNFCPKNPDAGRVAPISACVWCLNPFYGYVSPDANYVSYVAYVLMFPR